MTLTCQSLHPCTLYPIWAYWARVSPQSALLGIHFFLSQQTVRGASPWGTWLRTLHWWRKVRKDRKWRKNPAPGGIWTHNLLIARCMLYPCARTAAPCISALTLCSLTCLELFYFFKNRLIIPVLYAWLSLIHSFIPDLNPALTYIVKQVNPGHFSLEASGLHNRLCHHIDHIYIARTY